MTPNEQLTAAIEKLTEQVSALAEEVHVLRDAIDEVRGELQWLTRNADQFRPHVVQEARAWQKVYQMDPGIEEKSPQCD